MDASARSHTSSSFVHANTDVPLQEQNGNIRSAHRVGEKMMLVHLKDFFALVAICGFTGASLVWLDVAARLV
jgi:hypothetical protein